MGFPSLLLPILLSPAPQFKCLIYWHSMTLNIASDQGKYFKAMEVQHWPHYHGIHCVTMYSVIHRQSAKQHNGMAHVSKSWDTWIWKQKDSSKIEPSQNHSQWPTCRCNVSPSCNTRLYQVKGLGFSERMLPSGVLVNWKKGQPASHSSLLTPVDQSQRKELLYWW